MNRHLQPLAAFALAAASLAPLVCLAQEASDNGLEIVELSGQLEMILGNQIKLKTDDGQEAVVLVSDETAFQYQGTAEPTVLAPGLMVRFQAAFDAAGTPQAPLAELEIFRTAVTRRMTLEQRQSQTPGIYPVTEDQPQAENRRGAATAKAAAKAKPKAPAAQAARTPSATNARNNNLNNRNPATPPVKSEPSATAAGPVQQFLVVGMLRGMQADKLQIVAGNRPLIVQADPNLSIAVVAGDPLFCQPGDAIKLTGLKNPAGFIQADTIEVTGAKPLGSVDEKAQLRANRNSQRGRLGDGDDKTAPATGQDKEPREKAKPR